MSSKINSLILDEARKRVLRKLAIEIGFRHPSRLQDIANVARILAESAAFDLDSARPIIREHAPWLASEVDVLVTLITLEHQP